MSAEEQPTEEKGWLDWGSDLVGKLSRYNAPKVRAMRLRLLALRTAWCRCRCWPPRGLRLIPACRTNAVLAARCSAQRCPSRWRASTRTDPGLRRMRRTRRYLRSRACMRPRVWFGGSAASPLMAGARRGVRDAGEGGNVEQAVQAHRLR
eukprot:scaffold2737_cov218-Prasinococcus_capsulatus_cf.AAC.1